MAVGVFFPPALTRFRVGVRMCRLTPLFLTLLSILVLGGVSVVVTLFTFL